MKQDKVLIILIIMAFAVLLTDIAYVVYLGFTLKSVISGVAYLPDSFRSFTIAIIALNASLVPIAISYIFLRRK